VRIIALIIAGRDQHSQYIKVLARLTELLKDEVVRLKVLGVHDEAELYRFLTGQGV
jgi:mannitol/fructose-specific phosphotransferase system IIA component (Ntr-type)